MATGTNRRAAAGRGKTSTRKSTTPPRKRGKPPTDLPPAIPDETAAPQWLLRSTVYQRLPARERARLHRAIILRPAGLQTLAAIAEKFELAEKYGISATALRSYAERLEQLVRPAVTSQVVAGVLGCLPEAYRRQMVAGSQVMLISRVLQTMESPDATLSVAELAKLASILAALGRQGERPRKPARRGTTGRNGTEADESANDAAQTAEPTRLAEAVRTLYGLSWPPESEEAENATPTQPNKSADGNEPAAAVP